MSEKLVLIDGHSILNRAFYGVPDLTNTEGLHTNAIYGFLNIMFKIIEEEDPTYLAVAFDLSAPTFRHKMYDAYKGTRKPMPQELREQVPVMKEVLSAMGILTMEQEGFEADDILGTMAKRAEKEGVLVALVSGDRDLLQIATDKIKIRIPKTKGARTEIEDYYAKDVEEKYHVNAVFLMGIAAHESAWGTSRRAREDNNLTGYGVTSDHAKGINKSTKEAGLLATAETLHEKYLTSGGSYYVGTSAAAVNKHYCVGGEWAAAVVKNAYLLMNRL